MEHRCRESVIYHGSPSVRIDEKVAGLSGWRGEVLAWMRHLVQDAAPKVVEAINWIKPSNSTNQTTWRLAGIICASEIYKSYVKLILVRGTALLDCA